MSEPIEPPPPPPKTVPKYAIVDYVFQFITVTAGVLIALLINGLVEWNHNRELVAEARATIAREIERNKKDLDGTVASMPGDIQKLESALTFANEMLTKKKTSNWKKCRSPVPASRTRT